MNQIRFKTPSDMSYEELARLSGPTNAGQPEAVNWTYFDTQTVATLFTRINFFTAVPNLITNGNIQQANGFPEGEYFEIHYLGFELMVDAIDVTDPPNTLNNLLALAYSGRSFLQMIISNKLYGQWPLAHLGAPNAPTIVTAGIAAGTPLSFGQFGGSAVGVWLNGSVIIPPKQAFSFSVIADGTGVLTAPVDVRLSMIGNLYRLVR